MKALERATEELVAAEQDEVEAARRVLPDREEDEQSPIIDVGTAIRDGIKLQFAFGKLLDGLELQEADRKIVEERSGAVNTLLQKAIREAMGGLTADLENIQKEMAEATSSLREREGQAVPQAVLSRPEQLETRALQWWPTRRRPCSRRSRQRSRGRGRESSSRFDGSEAQSRDYTLYMRNLSRFGPTAKHLLQKRQHDFYVLPEVHTRPDEADEHLEVWARAGYKPVLTPSRASESSLRPGGVSAGCRNVFQFESFRNLSSEPNATLGMRDLQKGQQPVTSGVDFHDVVGFQTKVSGQAFSIFGIYLTTGVGLRGENARKLASLGSLLQSLRTPWLVIGDWNCEPEELQ
ncbi:unnamed protein product, partial [Prorocentrum cordatum]